jgi:hypothetical protein
MPRTAVRNSPPRARGAASDSGEAAQPDEVASGADRGEIVPPERAQELAAEVSGAGASGAEQFDGSLSDEERRRMISEAAYFIAQRRGFDGGLELEDWLAAEAEVNERLNHGAAPDA